MLVRLLNDDLSLYHNRKFLELTLLFKIYRILLIIGMQVLSIKPERHDCLFDLYFKLLSDPPLIADEMF